jgi:hypothetical protein
LPTPSFFAVVKDDVNGRMEVGDFTNIDGRQVTLAKKES